MQGGGGGTSDGFVIRILRSGMERYWIGYFVTTYQRKDDFRPWHRYEVGPIFGRKSELSHIVLGGPLIEWCWMWSNVLQDLVA